MANAESIARRWFEEVWNEKRSETIDELMAPDSRGHVEGEPVVGREAFRSMRAALLAAFPDLRLQIEDIVAEGERAAIRWRMRGHHSGEGFGIAATGRPVDVRGTTWLVIQDGQIVEGFDTWNHAGLLQSLR